MDPLDRAEVVADQLQQRLLLHGCQALRDGPPDVEQRAIALAQRSEPLANGNPLDHLTVDDSETKRQVLARRRLGQRVHKIEAKIQRRGAEPALSHGRTGVEHRIHSARALVFEDAAHQAATPCARLPRDMLERVARLMLPQLAQLVALAEDTVGANPARGALHVAPGLGEMSCLERPRSRQDRDFIRTRQEDLGPQQAERVDQGRVQAKDAMDSGRRRHGLDPNPRPSAGAQPQRVGRQRDLHPGSAMPLQGLQLDAIERGVDVKNELQHHGLADALAAIQQDATRRNLVR